MSDEAIERVDVPDGMSPDARETWPSRELISSWLGDAHADGGFGVGFEMRPGEPSGIDPDDADAVARARLFRDVLGRFASGIAVITSISGDQPVGMTCQSFSSVSLSPPLVLFCPAKTSRAWPLIQRSGRFCANFLAADQAELSNTMASKGSDKFADVPWTPAPHTGSPVLGGVLGYVDCTVQSTYEAGDHYLVLGRVRHLEAHAERAEPLLFFEGRYRTTRATRD